MANNSTRSGFLFLADISGYTSMLAESELEHAADIIRSLISSIYVNIRKPFSFVKYEGDALFYFLEGKNFSEEERIIDHVESVYSEFISEQRQMILNTKCPAARPT
jgi:hypothetical protein